MNDGASLPDSPYKGLARFDDSELDERFFFGRDRETEIVASNLIASRLSVLYGPSGVGKSSLLRAGVVRRLRALVPAGGEGGDENGALPVVVDQWRDDPFAAIAAAAGTPVPESPSELADVLAERSAQIGGEIYLVLDQMEEYFVYHGRDAGGPLRDALAEILTRPTLRVHVLLGIRDDALADLDAFKGRVPGLFGNVLRLDHLDVDSARAAIVEPLAELEAMGGPNVVAEPALVAAVVDQVASGRIERRLAGRGIVEGATRRGRVEAPYLQLVMERLWEVERQRDSSVLHAETLAELGGSGRIVQEHLERALGSLDEPERELVARLFHQLVTPSGTKIAHGVGDLSRYAGESPERLEDVLHALSTERVVRALPGRNGGGVRYEIYHDVLAGAVLEWGARHEAERALSQEREEARRRQRRLLAIAVGAMTALVLVGALAAYALVQRADARDRARAAKARELTVASLSALGRDPELALLLAVEASRHEQTPAVEAALRGALLRSRALAAVVFDQPVLAAVPSGAGVIAATSDGRLHRPNGSIRQLAPTFDQAVFSRTGRLLAGSFGRSTRVWTSSGEQRLATTSATAAVRLALDGQVLAVASADGGLVVHRLDGGRRTTFRLPSRATALAVQGDRLVVASGAAIRVFDLDRAALVAVWAPERTTILGVTIAPGGRQVLTLGADSAIRVRELPGGELANVMLGHLDFAKAAAFVPDGTRFVSIGGDGGALVWETETARLLARLAGHSAELLTVATSRDGLTAVTGDVAGVVRIWNATGDPEMRLLRSLDAPPLAVRWAGGRAVAVPEGSADPRVDARARIDGSLVRLPGGVVLRGHANDVTSVRYSPDGSRVITASRDRDARIWDPHTGASLVTLSGHFGAVADASLSPDGRFAVTAGPGSAGIWDARTGELLNYLRGHKGTLVSAVWTPDSRTVITAGADATVRSWRCAYCGHVDELVEVARSKLNAVGRRLTADEQSENGL